MATYSDNFNRANANTLGSAWKEIHGSGVTEVMGIAGNQASMLKPGPVIERYESNLSGSDMYSEARVWPGGMYPDVCVMARCNVPNPDTSANLQFYYFRYASMMGSPMWSVGKFLGSMTLISQDATPGTITNGDKLRIEVEGTNIRCYRNATKVFDLTDAAITAGSRAGIYCVGWAGNYFDDWEAGDLTSAPPEPIAMYAGVVV